MRALPFLLASLLSAVAATTALSADFTVPVDDRFTESSLQFTGDLGHVYYFRWAVFHDNGQFAVCGAGAMDNPRLKTTIAKMAKAGEVRAGGKRYKVDLGFFTKVASRDGIASAEATCRMIGPVPAEGAEYELRYGRGSFRG